MKRILFTLIALIASLGTFAEVTGEALTFRNQIKSYLSQEGYVPTIDTDGDIAFKYEGSKYFISVDNYGEMVYVTVSYYMNAEDTNSTLLRRVANDVERGLKLVRIYLTQNQQTLILECAAANTSIAEFRRMFYNYMEILTLAKERVTDGYNEE